VARPRRRSPLHAPPRIRGLGDDAGGTRHATWLELFFDLVFVVAVAQLAFALSHDLTLHGFLVFCGLFVPVWWAWVCFTVYADRFDSDDVVHRVVMLCGMFAVGAMASVIPDAALGDTAPFAFTYAVIQLLVVALTVRVWLNIPDARPLMSVYLPAFTATASLMLVSVAVPPPGRYWIWALALVVSVCAPLVARGRMERAPVHASHLPERVGLFTIIVLGETVVAVVIGTSTVEWSLKSGIVAALGFVLAAGFWWIYFDYLDGETLVGRSIRAGQAYFYSHLPLTAGIVALGVGVEHAVEETSGTELHDGTRWLLCGGLALAFVSLAVIHRIAADATRDVDVWLRLGVAGVALAVALLGGSLGPTAAMSLLAAAVGACLAVELALSQRDADELEVAVADASMP
jgi:low temperature requirement protein LtrA